jgi:hypothetical protein
VKTTILADGTLSVSPESELEAFALNCWAKENITADWYAANRHAPIKIIVDMSGYAGRLGCFMTMREATR